MALLVGGVVLGSINFWRFYFYMKENIFRPTIRCAAIYKNYYDSLYKSTTLDKNQLMRLALFVAPYNPIFLHRIGEHHKKHHTFPAPLWTPLDNDLWLIQNGNKREDKGIVISL